jgi:hypothetical protein
MGDQQNNADDAIKAVVKRALQKWEPEFYRNLRSCRDDFNFVRHVEIEPDNMGKVVADVTAATAQLVSTWVPPPDQDEVNALTLIAFLIKDHREWDKSNDMVATMMVGLITQGQIRGHSDGVVRYCQGSFREIEELGQVDMRLMEKTLQNVAKFLVVLMKKNVGFNVREAFSNLKGRKLTAMPPVSGKDFHIKRDTEYAGWAYDAAKAALAMTARFTGKGQSEVMVELIGTWLQVPRPDVPSTCCSFEDGMVQIDDSKAGNARVVSVPKSPLRNCYFHMECELGLVVPDWAKQRLQETLVLCWANNEESWKVDTAYESLAWMNQLIPPVANLLYGDGGNSKSARTLLRANVWGDHHKTISPTVFQVPEEFRKQGCHFSSARVGTVQEVAPGQPVMEPELKKVISGEFIACRPLYGKTTTNYRWNRMALWWEFNSAFFKLAGDPNDLPALRAWTRRFNALKYLATFSSDPTKIDIDNLVFPESSDLAIFLESPYARVEFIWSVLIPWVKQHTAQQSREIVMNPPEVIKNQTRRVVATMANGGIEVPESFRTVVEESKELKVAEDTVRKAWLGTVTWGSSIKAYDIKKIKTLPGTFRIGCNRASREDNLREAVGKWPHLLQWNEGRCGWYARLDMDLHKFDEIMLEFGEEAFGGGFSKWETVWKCEEILRSTAEWSLEADENTVLAAQTLDDPVLEVANMTCMQESLEDGTAQDPQYMREYLQVCKRIPNSDYGEVQVVYYTKHGIPGRDYARKPCGQWMCTHDKKIVFFFPQGCSYGSKVAINIDVNNCFVTLFVNELESNVDLSLFPTVSALKQHYKIWRQGVAKYMGISVREAKKVIIAIVHLGRPPVNLPFLWNLAVEVQKGIELLLALDKYAYLNGRFKDRRNPLATKFHYAMAALEKKLMTEALNELGDRCDNLSVNTLMFDGAILLAPADEVPAIKHTLEQVGAKWKVCFDVEVW